MGCASHRHSCLHSQPQLEGSQCHIREKGRELQRCAGLPQAVPRDPTHTSSLQIPCSHHQATSSPRPLSPPSITARHRCNTSHTCHHTLPQQPHKKKKEKKEKKHKLQQLLLTQHTQILFQPVINIKNLPMRYFAFSFHTKSAKSSALYTLMDHLYSSEQHTWLEATVPYSERAFLPQP